MKKLLKVLPIAVFALVLSAVVSTVPAAYGQSDQSGQSNPSGQPQSPAAQSQAEQIIQGQLASVDTDNSTFTIKLSDNTSMQFKFDQNTKVVGSSTGVQGLTNETGTNLAVHYKTQDDQKMATQIEVLK